MSKRQQESETFAKVAKLKSRSLDPILVNVFSILKDKGLLTSKEQCRLYLFTSQELNREVFGGDRSSFWNHIGKIEFGERMDHVLTTTGRTAEECFRMLKCPQMNTVDHEKRTYAPSDYFFAFHIFRGSETLLYQVVPGEQMGQFFVDGSCRLRLDQPLVFASSEECEFIIKVDLWRVADDKCIRNLATTWFDDNFFENVCPEDGDAFNSGVLLEDLERMDFEDYYSSRWLKVSATNAFRETYGRRSGRVWMRFEADADFCVLREEKERAEDFESFWYGPVSLVGLSIECRMKFAYDDAIDDYYNNGFDIATGRGIVGWNETRKWPSFSRFLENLPEWNKKFPRKYTRTEVPPFEYRWST